MNTPTPRSTSTHNRASGWGWSAAQPVLPNGLPVGALTVIRLRFAGNPVRDWRNSVADLVHSTLTNERPVAYVPVDSDNAQPVGRLAPSTAATLGIILDEDHLVSARDDQGRVRTYGCGVPTMDRVLELVGGFEHAHGPSLVLLDGVQHARPYNRSPRTAGRVVFPGGVTISQRGVDEWRALDLSGYAQTRPHAPTVAVWFDDSTAAHAASLDVLCDVALVVIEACSHPGGSAYLTVSARGSINEPLPYQRAIHLPC